MRLLKKYGLTWLVSLLLTTLTCGVVMEVLPTTVVERIDHFLYDLRMRAQPTEHDPRIVIVDIDEKSLDQIGRWPWSRNVVADLTSSLADHYKAKSIGFDIIFAEPDTSSGFETLRKLSQHELKDTPGLDQRLRQLRNELDYDGRLAAAIKDKPVVMGFLFSNEPRSVSKGVLPPPAFSEEELEGRRLDTLNWTSYTANLARLQSAASSGGFFNPVLDQDGVVRSVPLLAKIDGNYYESLAIATTRAALGANTVRPVFLQADAMMSEEALRQYGAIASLAMDGPLETIDIPVERRLTTLVRYGSKGGVEDSHFTYLSAVDIIKRRLPLSALEGKIVLVGTTVPGLYDLRATPVSPNYPGVEIHANVIASILDANFLHRPDFSVGYDLLQVILVGLLLGICLPLLGPLVGMGLSFVTAVIIVVLNFVLYSYGNLVLPMASALLLVAVLFVSNLGWSYLFEVRSRRAMVGLFGEYVAPELVAEMAANPKAYSMEGESRDLTVLFSDVRGFTTISESLQPNELREYINDYLTAMSEDIRNNRGTLDKYIGDAVMAFWGAPVFLPDHASLAVATALKMQESVIELNQRFAKRKWPALHIGIGINTGLMRVGDMGSKVRRAYTVMGDAVNLGSRLEAITKVYGVGVIVGVQTREAAPEYAYRELDRVRVKGKNEPVPIFEPMGLFKELNHVARARIEKWHDALAAIRAMRWDEAEQKLQALQADKPHGLYTLYLQRIQHYRDHAPPADWDGVTTFDTK